MFYNKSTGRYYCAECARKINSVNREVLCVPVGPSELDLAKALHEAGRAAVEARQTVAHSMFGVQPQKFIEWGEMTEEGRNGRVIQARWLLERFQITPKT